MVLLLLFCAAVVVVPTEYNKTAGVLAPSFIKEFDMVLFSLPLAPVVVLDDIVEAKVNADQIIQEIRAKIS